MKPALIPPAENPPILRRCTEQLMLTDVPFRSGGAFIAIGLQSPAPSLYDTTVDQQVRWIYRAVTAVDGGPTPSLWAIGAYQALPQPSYLLLTKNFSPAQLQCQACRRGRRLLIRRDQTATDVSTVSSRRLSRIVTVSPPILRYQGHRLELAESSTVVPPTEIRLSDLLLVRQRCFPLPPHRSEHPRWILAVQEFRTYVWEMTGISPADSWFWPSLIQPLMTRVMGAWEQGDWEGFQNSIARGKQEVAALHVSNMLAGWEASTAEGTA